MRTCPRDFRSTLHRPTRSQGTVPLRESRFENARIDPVYTQAFARELRSRATPTSRASTSPAATLPEPLSARSSARAPRRALAAPFVQKKSEKDMNHFGFSHTIPHFPGNRFCAELGGNAPVLVFGDARFRRIRILKIRILSIRIHISGRQADLEEAVNGVALRAASRKYKKSDFFQSQLRSSPARFGTLGSAHDEARVLCQ